MNDKIHLCMVLWAICDLLNAMHLKAFNVESDKRKRKKKGIMTENNDVIETLCPLIVMRIIGQ